MYEYDQGVFVAHPRIKDKAYHPFGAKKVLSDKAKVVDVEREGNVLYVTTESTEHAPLATWTKIDKVDEEEATAKSISLVNCE